MMSIRPKRAGWTAGIALFVVASASAQVPARPSVQGLLPSPGILRNSVTNLHAEGSALWVGPFLNHTRDGGRTWQVADSDSLAGLRNRVYSLDIEGDVIWVGLGASREQEISGETETVNVARGFLFSTDAGQTWQYRSHLAPIDSDDATTGILDLPEDTLTAYGNALLPTLAVTVPELSPPWDVDYDPASGHVWAASELAGLRRSADMGRTWHHIVLPPDTSRFLSPDLGYEFPFFSQPTGIPVAQFRGLNFQAFAVLADANGSVWAGTPAGLNRSDDGGRSWYRFDTGDGLPGNWVISIEEQTRPGQSSTIWATTWPGRDETHRFGAVATADGGASFRSVLHGERVYDFAFDGSTVYVAGANGLFISTDDGYTFRTVREFHDASRPERSLRPGSRVFAVATTGSELWVGTEDGLLMSTNGGATWSIFRTEVPLSPEGLPALIPQELVPSVDTYAYPNPFSPSGDRLVRLRYRLDRQASVTIRIFDFGMNLVRTLTRSGQGEGEHEVSWDGTDSGGARVANGPYFYAIRAAGNTWWGKILVLE